MEVYDEHDILFHYTTEEGVIGILQTQTLYATHYKYMNDTSEVFHLADKLKEIAKPHVQEAIASIARHNDPLKHYINRSGGLAKVIDEEVGKMIASLYRVTFGIGREDVFLSLYYTCLCSHKPHTYERDNGLLSQWRAYGRGAGYALVFDVKQLAELFAKDGLQHFYGYGGFGDVVYDDEEDKFVKEFPELIRLISEQMPQLAIGGRPELNKLYTPFASCVSRYKHRAFTEEREVRISLSPVAKSVVDPTTPRYKKKTEKKVHFRDRLVPYIKLFDEATGALPITKIIVGPNRDKELRRERLEHFVKTKGMKIDVVCSSTPLV